MLPNQVFGWLLLLAGPIIARVNQTRTRINRLETVTIKKLAVAKRLGALGIVDFRSVIQTVVPLH